MLTKYQNDTQRLLQNPPAPTTLYSLADIDVWINTARGQVAGEGECIRAHGTIDTIVGQRSYNFSDIAFGNSTQTGIQGAIHVRSILGGIGAGQQWVTPRPTEWFDLYCLNNPVPGSGFPQTWAQYGQGSAPPVGGASAGGTFSLDPIPDAVYTLTCSCACYPIPLTDDATLEAIPYLWTDAVPFFAAYFALLSSQTSARQADAERIYQHYQTFMERARKASNPSVLRWQYSQASDPTQAAKIGLKAGA